MKDYVRFESVRNFLTVVFASIVLNACLTDEVNNTDADEISFDIAVSGSVGGDPVVGSSITVRASDGAMLSELQSGSNADYSININTRSDSFPLTVDAFGGTDLVTNRAPVFSLTSAVFEPGPAKVANVNPFSTIAVALAAELPGGRTRDNLENAQQIVSSALNSGLDGLASTGPITTAIDESNILEIVKASLTLTERIRRTSNLLLTAGFSSSGNQVVDAISSDLTDRVVDGLGGSNVDRRTAAVATIVSAQVLLESMANELQTDGADAAAAMRSAVDQVSDVPPGTTFDELAVTGEMISMARIGLAAAYALNPDVEILDLHTTVSGIQPGQSSSLVRVFLPSGYRTALQSTLAMIAAADDTTVDLVNAIARSDGEINAANLAPSIQGSPGASVVAGSDYLFQPTASDADGDVLTFTIVNAPSWAIFDSSTGELSGTPQVSDAGSYDNIEITVTDGEFSASLTAFSIEVTVAASNSAPQISGSAPANVNAGDNYSFTPTASDPDGDTLSFSVSGLPSWASFDNATGEISGTPAAGDVDSYSDISIVVSDSQLNATLGPFAITVQSVSVGSVSLSWAAPTQNEDGTPLNDLAGYRIYWGTIPDNYPNLVTIDNSSVTTFIVDNLAPGTYNFVATSFNSSGVESRYSAVAIKVVP